MGVGGGVALLAVGAILAFAVDVDLRGLNVNLVGLILMAAGVLVLVLDQRILARLRNRRTGTQTPTDPAGRVITRSVRDDERR